MNERQARMAGVTRRELLGRAARLGVAASTLGSLELLARSPQRAQAEASALPEVQYAIDPYIAPAQRHEGVKVRFAPVYTCFATISRICWCSSLKRRTGRIP